MTENVTLRKLEMALRTYKHRQQLLTDQVVEYACQYYNRVDENCNFAGMSGIFELMRINTIISSLEGCIQKFEEYEQLEAQRTPSRIRVTQKECVVIEWKPSEYWPGVYRVVFARKPEQPLHQIASAAEEFKKTFKERMEIYKFSMIHDPHLHSSAREILDELCAKFCHKGFEVEYRVEME